MARKGQGAVESRQLAAYAFPMIPRDRLTETLQRSPEVMSGALVFKGTRVPVQTLIDHLEAGDGLDVFLADFPSVTRERRFR